MPRKLNTNRENNERNGEQVFNFEDLYKLKLKSIVLGSSHSFRTVAFLLAPLLLSPTSTHAVHISWQNNGISSNKVPLTKSR